MYIFTLVILSRDTYASENGNLTGPKELNKYETIDA